MLLVLLTSAAALMSADDMRALDGAIETCNREAALPVFTDEMRRRSVTATAAYEEQQGINQERAEIAARRNAPDGSDDRALGKDALAKAQRELARVQQALDDRQRALDDLRRLEGMRREAIDLKRQYFLLRCPARKSAER
ncbi:hypothetical protein [Sphingomonas arenae]|nr:hypothetical protein [Sphingomonas arenae]